MKQRIDNNLKKKIIHQNDPQYNQYDPYPHQRPGPKLDTQDKKLESEIKLQPFNHACQTIQNIFKINYESIISVEVSENSNDGVVYVNTSEGAFVVKGHGNSPLEYFLNKICLVLNINSPKMRVVSYLDQEFEKLIYEIQRATVGDEILHYRVNFRLDHPFLLIMEYIPSITLIGMGKQRASRIFSHQVPEGRDRLINIGKIIVFDTLIHNYDRFPLVWDNEGNAGNLIFQAATGFTTTNQQLLNPEDELINFQKVYAIDNHIMTVNVKSDQAIQNLHRYFTKIENFLNGVILDVKRVMEAQIDLNLMDVGTSISSIDSIVKFIKDNTGYELREMDKLQIMIGIILGVENLCQVGHDRIGNLFKTSFIEENRDWKGYWNQTLDKVNIEILNDIINLYLKFRGVYAEVIKWCKDITLNQYHPNNTAYEQLINGEMVGYGNELNPNIEMDKELLKQIKKQEDQEYEDLNLQEFKILSQQQNDVNKIRKEEELDKRIHELFDIDLKQVETELKKGKNIQDYMKLPGDKSKK